MTRVLVCAFLAACGAGTEGGGATPDATDGTDLSTDTGPAENTRVACQDGVDNDGDGFTDLDDYDCANVTGVCGCEGEASDALCSNGTDDDGDGFTDCDDFDCSRNPDVTVCGT